VPCESAGDDENDGMRNEDYGDTLTFVESRLTKIFFDKFRIVVFNEGLIRPS